MQYVPNDFWDKSEYSKREYEAEPLTPELVSEVEKKLGYKLPRSYIDLMRTQNGGIPTRTCYRTSQKTSWADDHVAIHGIYAISSTKFSTLCGQHGSDFWTEQWGYPPIGVYFADCPSAGHDMICLDYSAGGPDMEPRVVHVDQEREYRVTVLAATFEEFIRGLEPEDNFPIE